MKIQTDLRDSQKAKEEIALNRTILRTWFKASFVVKKKWKVTGVSAFQLLCEMEQDNRKNTTVLCPSGKTNIRIWYYADMFSIQKSKDISPASTSVEVMHDTPKQIHNLVACVLLTLFLKGRGADAELASILISRTSQSKVIQPAWGIH